MADSNVAEFMAIRKALSVFVDSEWAGSTRLIMESDSSVAIAWVLGKEFIPWRLRFAYNKIKALYLASVVFHLLIFSESKIC